MNRIIKFMFIASLVLLLVPYCFSGGTFPSKVKDNETIVNINGVDSKINSYNWEYKLNQLNDFRPIFSLYELNDEYNNNLYASTLNSFKMYVSLGYYDYNYSFWQGVFFGNWSISSNVNDTTYSILVDFENTYSSELDFIKNHYYYDSTSSIPIARRPQNILEQYTISDDLPKWLRPFVVVFSSLSTFITNFVYNFNVLIRFLVRW